MCVDLNVGEPYPIGGHHSSTGLLSPLLLGVAAVLLLIICVCHYIKDAYAEKRKKRKAKKRTQTQDDMVSADDDKIKKISDGQGHTMNKSKTHQKFDEIMKETESTPKWQTAIKMTEIVENQSRPYDLDKIKYYYENDGLQMEYDDDYAYDYEEDETPIHHRQNEINHGNITSLDTLGHLLDDKPWRPRTRTH